MGIVASELCPTQFQSTFINTFMFYKQQGGPSVEIVLLTPVSKVKNKLPFYLKLLDQHNIDTIISTWEVELNQTRRKDHHSSSTRSIPMSLLFAYNARKRWGDLNLVVVSVHQKILEQDKQRTLCHLPYGN